MFCINTTERVSGLNFTSIIYISVKYFKLSNKNCSYLEFKYFNCASLYFRSPDYTHGIFQSIGFKEFHSYLLLSDEERESASGEKLLKQGKIQDLYIIFLHMMHRKMITRCKGIIIHNYTIIYHHKHIHIKSHNMKQT